MISSLLLFSIFCFAFSNCQVHPVDHDNCTVNSTILHPCYTLQQLIDNEFSSWFSRRLEFLPGKHVITENQTLKASGFNMTLCPFDEQQEVMIECQLNTLIIFQKMVDLKILSLHFTYCTLRFEKRHKFMGITYIHITKSIFENSRQWYAITVLHHTHKRVPYSLNFRPP